MIKFLGMAVMAVLIVGCGDYQGDTSKSYVGETDITDNSVDNSIDRGTYIYDNNGTVTYYGPNNGNVTELADGTLEDIPDEPSGDYDATYTEGECAANGYFWCPLEEACLNQPATGSSCSK